MRSDEIIRRVISKLVPNTLYLTLARLYNRIICLCKMGLRKYCRLKKVQAACRSDQVHEFKLTGLDYPVLVRPGTTDALVMESNLIRKSWGCYIPPFDVSFIIDAGAYVGYSSVYFLNTFKEAQIYGLEPDPDNFELALRNLKPYGGRVKLFKAAIWPVKSPLRLVLGDRADGIHVVPVSEGEVSDVQGIDPLSLLQESRHERINIFKCDIEEAERWLFT